METQRARGFVCWLVPLAQTALACPRRVAAEPNRATAGGAPRPGSAKSTRRASTGGGGDVGGCVVRCGVGGAGVCIRGGGRMGMERCCAASLPSDGEGGERASQSERRSGRHAKPNGKRDGDRPFHFQFLLIITRRLASINGSNHFKQLNAPLFLAPPRTAHLIPILISMRDVATPTVALLSSLSRSPKVTRWRRHRAGRLRHTADKSPLPQWRCPFLCLTLCLGRDGELSRRAPRGLQTMFRQKKSSLSAQPLPFMQPCLNHREPDANRRCNTWQTNAPHSPHARKVDRAIKV